jgi:hypothetical protein
MLLLLVINHGLNTRAVLVSIHRNAAPYDEVETEVQKTMEVLLFYLTLHLL